jgi:hypothetical protein
MSVGPHVRVRCEPPGGAMKGNWPRYAGKLGTIAQVNARDGEIGVVLDGHAHAVVWFRAEELRVLSPLEAYGEALA